MTLTLTNNFTPPVLGNFSGIETKYECGVVCLCESEVALASEDV